MVNIAKTKDNGKEVPPPLRVRTNLDLWSAEQKLNHFAKLTVWHTQMRDIWNAIEMCHHSPALSQPECLIIFGPTRVGKSHILKLYRMKYPRYVKSINLPASNNSSFAAPADVTVTPVLYGRVKCPASIGAVACSMLEALGDPFPDRSEKVYAKTARLQKLIERCGVQLIVLDEIQHFVDRDKKKLIEDSSDWLKTDIIDKLELPVIIVGTSEGEGIFANPQLNGRFLNRMKLLPFNPKKQELEFTIVLRLFDNELPLKGESQLWAPDTWERIYFATNGRMFYIRELLRRSLKHAIEKHKEVISHKIMSDIYEHHLSFLGLCQGNPFDPSFDVDRGWQFVPLSDSELRDAAVFNHKHRTN